MPGTGTAVRPDELAEELFDVLTRLGFGGARGRRRDGALKDLEFRTLALLQRRKTMTVGDIQRRLGVPPAQMARGPPALGGPEGPFVHCRIHPRAKRKIHVV